jgi:hypothetical protein
MPKARRLADRGIGRLLRRARRQRARARLRLFRGMLIATRLSSDGKGRRGSPLRGFRNDECELLDTILQHDASAARCDQLGAKFLKVSAVVVCDADVVAHAEA